MYSTLHLYGHNTYTTNKHYNCPAQDCPSLPLPTYHPPPTITDIVISTPPPTTTKIDFIHTPPSTSPSNLLPVMEPAFNLREICKQCILLEDHLSQQQKRCSDCCTKHFLALEALAEEAITLDQHNNYQDILINLPSIIRSLQLEWIQDPTSHTTLRNISQKLREIRKQFQEQCFDIIGKGCENGCVVR